MNKTVIIGFVVIAFSLTAGLASSGFNFAEAAGGWKPAVDALLAQITGLGERTSEIEDEVFCSGNGTYDSGARTCACDPGFPGLDCSVTVSVCGNGNVDPGEVCDDGNNVNGDGCSADCLSVEICGNFIVDVTAGETCDDGNITDDGNGCSSICQLNSICGNGILEDLTEECDDGNTTDGDGCSSTCQTEIGECGGQPAGTACGDSTNDSCTNPDTCDGVGNCLDNHESTTTVCDDGESCSVNDVCDGAGLCVGTPLVCDDGVACTQDTCSEGLCSITPNDSLCDDGLFCNGQEVCDIVDGCIPSGDPCDGGMCNEAADVCEP